MDEADITSVNVDLLTDAETKRISREAANIPKGVPGECVKCGEDSPRLVKGVCAPCRDKYKLP